MSPYSPGLGDNATIEELLGAIAGFVTEPYDTVELTYVAAGNGEGEVETAIYKLGAVTVTTLTLTYDSSNRITSVVAS